MPVVGLAIPADGQNPAAIYIKGTPVHQSILVFQVFRESQVVFRFFSPKNRWIWPCSAISHRWSWGKLTGAVNSQRQFSPPKGWSSLHLPPVVVIFLAKCWLLQKQELQMEGLVSDKCFVYIWVIFFQRFFY